MLHQVINRLDGVKTGDLMLLPLLMPVIVRFGLFFFIFYSFCCFMYGLWLFVKWLIYMCIYVSAI